MINIDNLSNIEYLFIIISTKQQSEECIKILNENNWYFSNPLDEHLPEENYQLFLGLKSTNMYHLYFSLEISIVHVDSYKISIPELYELLESGQLLTLLL